MTMEKYNYGAYEYLEMLEPRRSNSLPSKCRSSAPYGNVSKSHHARISDTDKLSNIKPDDMQKIVHKIRNVFSILKSSNENQYQNSSVIETDYEKDKRPCRIDSQLPDCNSYGTFEDAQEYKSCCSLARHLKHTLAAAAKDTQLLCDLVLPALLLSHVAQDVARMSHCEPCGVRGCVIFITLDDGSPHALSLGKIVCDSSIVPTFELYLTLKEDTRSWVTVRKLLFFIQTCFREEKNCKKNPPRVLSEGFLLVKKKLYRPN